MIFVLLVLLLATPAIAEEAPAIVASPLVPPAAFDHPFTGVLTVERVNGRVNVEKICKKPRAVACANLYTVGGCHLYILDDYSLDHQLVVPITYLQLYRHEVAHCNGWPADHPMSPPWSPPGPMLVLHDQDQKPAAAPPVKYDVISAIARYAARRAKELGLE